MRKIKQTGSYALALALAASCSTQAMAQDADESNDGEGLNVIIVTAQKQAENLQAVPVSVTALSSSAIDGLKMRDAGEIASQIPNLQTSNPLGDGFPVFSLRGVSMSDFSLNQSSPVASYVDEVYKGNPAIQGVQIYDLERIEVLRGPQGTLYGKNSTGGAVNFITKRPDMRDEGYLTLGAGNYGRFEARGAAEVALDQAQTLGLRVAGTFVKANGWQDNVLPGLKDGSAIHEYGFRGTLLWQPNDQLEIVLRAATGKQNAVNYGIQAINITPDGVGAGLYGLYNLLGATTAVDSTRAGLGFFEFDSNQDIKRVIRNDSASLTINWEASDSVTLTSITSWDKGRILNPEDVDGTSNAVLDAAYFGRAKQFAQDLRITTDLDGPFNFIAGAYFADEKVFNSTEIGFYRDLDLNADGNVDLFDCVDVIETTFGAGPVTPSGVATEAALNGFGLSLANFAPAGCAVQNDFNQRRKSYAGYFNGKIQATENLRLQIGARYSHDKAVLNNFSARILGNDGTPLLNTIPGDLVDPFAIAAPQRLIDKEWSGKVGLDYTFDSGNMIYSHYSRGYRSGGFNAQAFFDPSELTTVKPETLDAFEVGFKTRFSDDRFQLNGSFFTYGYRNQQFLNIDPATLAQTLINIDKSRIKGMELEFSGKLASSFLLTASLGLLDSEVKRGTLGGVDLAGNKLPLAPSVNAGLGFDWMVLETSSGALRLQADVSYISSHYFDIFNVQRLKQDSYALANARLEYEFEEPSIVVGIWMKNIGEKKYYSSLIDLQSSFGFDYAHIGAPRTFGADVTIRY